MFRLLGSPEWVGMCAGGATPTLHLPDFLCNDLANLENLVMAGKVCLARGEAEQLLVLCGVLEIPDIAKEAIQVMRCSDDSTTQVFIYSLEVSATSGRANF
jgi:hypothetical protein